MMNKFKIAFLTTIISISALFCQKSFATMKNDQLPYPEIDGFMGTSIQLSSSAWISLDARTPGMCYSTQSCIGDGTQENPQAGYESNYFYIINTGTSVPAMLSWSGAKSFVTVYGESQVRFCVQYNDDYGNCPSTGYPKAVYWPEGTSNRTTVSLSTTTTHWMFIAEVSLPCGKYNYQYLVKNDTCSIIYELNNGSFVITERPRDVVNASVEESSYVGNAKVVLRWNAVNPESGGTTYKVYVGKDPNNLTLVYEGPNNYYQLDSLDTSSKYHWKVEAVNIYGVSAFSAIYSFETIASIAKAFNYPNPFNPARNETTGIVFEMPDRGSAEITVFTEFGDICWRRNYDNLNKGTNQIDYDGRDDDGRDLYNGTYVCMIKKKYSGGERVEKCRILVIK